MKASRPDVGLRGKKKGTQVLNEALLSERRVEHELDSLVQDENRRQRDQDAPYTQTPPLSS